jgi:hypothetical protein
MHEIIEVELPEGEVKQYVELTFPDGSGKVFPVDESVPEYVAWLEQNGEVA